VGASYLCGTLAVVGEERGRPGGGGRGAPKNYADLIIRGALYLQVSSEAVAAATAALVLLCAMIAFDSELTN
jgi:hypothetical protein